MLICKNCLDKELLEKSVCGPCSLGQLHSLSFYLKKLVLLILLFPLFPFFFLLPESNPPSVCSYCSFLTWLEESPFLLLESRENPYVFLRVCVPFIIWSTINNTWRAYLKYQLIYWKKKTAASNCSPAETRNLTTAINCMKIILTSQRGYSQGRG